MITAFLAGLVAGYGIAIPVGAVAAYLITLGAAHGFPTAAAGGLGAASVDALYAGVAVALGALLAPLIMAVATPLRWLSALVLVGVAVRMIVLGLRPRSSSDQPPDAPVTGSGLRDRLPDHPRQPGHRRLLRRPRRWLHGDLRLGVGGGDLRARRRDRLGQLAAAARGGRCRTRAGADRTGRPPLDRVVGAAVVLALAVWTLLAP